MITRFPADELLVTGTTYVRGADFAPPRTASLDGASAMDGVADAESRRLDRRRVIASRLRANRRTYTRGLI